MAAVTADTLGAWVLKAALDDAALDALVAGDFAGIGSRCLRPTYRADLVADGQPVLLWISGSSRHHPAGFYAQGRTTGPAGPELDEDGRLVRPVPVRLHALSPPVLRAELRPHEVLSRIEVLRMPAGSNPSFLTRRQLDALRAGWPQVQAVSARAPGWCRPTAAG